MRRWSFRILRATAKKDTHYAIEESEAVAVRHIFQRLGMDGYTTRKLGIELEGLYPPPFQGAHWRSSSIVNIVHNPVYKGEFIANRWRQFRDRYKDDAGREVRVHHLVQRPPEEWIIVPVPAIVSPALWEAANRALKKNQQTAPRRSGKNPYLLTGLIRCACCGMSFNGNRKKDKQANGEIHQHPYYSCSSIHREPATRWLAFRNCGGI